MIDFAMFSAATLSLLTPALYAQYLGRDINYVYHNIRGPHQ
jgi:hypothetical protein